MCVHVHTHTRTHAHTHTRTHSNTLMRARARARTHTHTHTHTQGIELVRDRATKEPVPESLVAAVTNDCLQQGVIVGRYLRERKSVRAIGRVCACAR